MTTTYPADDHRAFFVAKPDLGSKHQCENCGTKFFDLNKDPIVCPKCDTTFQAAPAVAARPTRSSEKDDDETETAEDPRTVSLKDADQVEDGKVEAAATDDDADAEDDDTDDSADDDDAFLEDDEDDEDVTGLVEGGDEDEEDR